MNTLNHGKHGRTRTALIESGSARTAGGTTVMARVIRCAALPCFYVFSVGFLTYFMYGKT